MFLCRKKCHLINSDKTLKKIHYGRKNKKLDGKNCRTANTVFAGRCKIHGDIYIGNNGEDIRKRLKKHNYDAKNRPDNNEIHQDANVWKWGGSGLCQCKCLNIIFLNQYLLHKKIAMIIRFSVSFIKILILLCLFGYFYD